MSGHHHDHSHHSKKNITVAFWLNSVFAVIELVGGILTNSVAIISDALHDFGDSLSLGLSLYFEKKAGKKRDDAFSYGYGRFSILGALINAVILIVGSVIVVQEALTRILNPEIVHVQGMVGLAVLGIIANTLAYLKLHQGSSINERVISLHFVEDILGWVAVLIGGILMMFYNLPILDPILSLGIAAYILINVYKNLREALHIILQGIPESMNIETLEGQIKQVPGVVGTHDIHGWTLDGKFNIMTVHLVISKESTSLQARAVKKRVKNLLKDYKIHHLTIELEWEGDPCTLKDC